MGVHGIFGGAMGYRGAAFRMAGRRLLQLDTMYISRHSSEWNWKNGDLVLLDWFRDVGHRLSFDVVHLLEWDLLLAERLDRLYAAVPPEAVGLTAYTPISVIGEHWRWVARPDGAREWNALLAYARDRLGYDGTPHGCIGVGPCCPRSFLRDYAAVDPPDLGNDELRFPLFAEALGYPVVDTGFRRRWHDPDEDRYFNASARPIDPRTVAIELAKPDGRRAFHPVRNSIPDLAWESRPSGRAGNAS
ncbi:hypothetical protein [Streptomyces sp. ISL-98]|uniref:hypothetical protein n=1 Tax=Streptomyces sp. ISL-98 TaxID=2819192 RepID=UPI001BEC73BC|nr:hypothetical protein [Streptomyces sp. ISL-98]